MSTTTVVWEIEKTDETIYFKFGDQETEIDLEDYAANNKVKDEKGFNFM